MVDWLISNFHSRYRIACLSRGYQRESKGFVVAHAESSVGELGDEAHQIYRKWGGVIRLAVDADRRNGIKEILHLFPEINLIILDDAMQHRWVKPTFLIQLSPFSKPFFQNPIFPLGMRRDTLEQYQRADALVFTKAGVANSSKKIEIESAMEKEKLPYAQTYVSSVKYLEAKNLHGQVLKDGSEALAIAGLASNQAFFNYVSARFSIARCISKPDHYRYLPSFFRDAKIENLPVVTTEKDFAKLLKVSPRPESVFCISIEMEIYPAKNLIQQIENKISI